MRKVHPFPIVVSLVGFAAGIVVLVNCTGKAPAPDTRVLAPTTAVEIDAAPADFATLKLNPVMPTANEVKYVYKSNGTEKVFEAPMEWRLLFATDKSGVLSVSTFLDNNKFDDAVTVNGRMAETSAGAITPIYQLLQNVVPAGMPLRADATWQSAPPTAAQLAFWAQSTALVSMQDRDYRIEGAWTLGEYTVVRARSVIYRFTADTLGLQAARAQTAAAGQDGFKAGRAAIEGFGVADVLYGGPGSGFEGGLPIRIADSYLESEVSLDTPAASYMAANVMSLETMCVSQLAGPDAALTGVPFGIPKPVPAEFRVGCNQRQ